MKIAFVIIRFLVFVTPFSCPLGYWILYSSQKKLAPPVPAYLPTPCAPRAVEQLKLKSSNMATQKPNAGKAAQKRETIALAEAANGNQLNWFYGDMVGGQYPIKSVSRAETKKKNPCFEIEVDEREKPVRIMPINAVQSGIADIVGGEITVVANVLTATNEDGAIALEKVS